MATQTKSSIVKSKPSGYQESSSSKAKFDSSVNKKKVVGTLTKQSVDSKHKFSTIVNKTEVKGKATSSSSKTTTKTTTVKTREKKVFSLAGQKYDPPEEREPLRIFYESLSEQIPSSEMAEFWMMEHGLLSPERAKKAYEKKQRKQKQIRMGTPIKSPPPPPLPVTRPESLKKQQQASKNGDVKAKKRIVDSDDDDDFVLSHKRRKGLLIPIIVDARGTGNAHVREDQPGALSVRIPSNYHKKEKKKGKKKKRVTGCSLSDIFCDHDGDCPQYEM